MKRILLPLLLCVLFLCGCTYYREIDRGYLVNAIGIYSTDTTTQIYLEAQTTALTEKSLEKSILTDSGNCLANAFSNLKASIVKPLYFEQTAVVVFTSKPSETEINFLTNELKLNYGTYVVKSTDVKTLFEYDSPSHILGYDIITLIKNFEKENGSKSNCRLFEIIKSKTALSAVNIYNDKLIFEGIKE